MKPLIVAACIVAAVQVALLPASTAPGLPSTNVAWLPAAADADIERAVGQARAEKKPLLLYWGTTWCPPCNQFKATLFNRQDFAALSRSFVAVHVDGDRPWAQKLGRRFKVSGYPTVVLFGPEGAEITRLPGEVDAPQVMAVLQVGLAGGWPVKAVLAATLVRLAVASPAADAESTTHLWLQPLAASDDGQGVKPDAALRERVLADPALAWTQMDVLTGGAADIVRTLDGDGSPGRAQVVGAFESALKRLEGDATLSRNDRLGLALCPHRTRAPGHTVAVTEPPQRGGHLEAPWGDLVATMRATTVAAAAAEHEALFFAVGRPEVFAYGSYYLTGFLNEKPLAVLRDDLAALGLTRDAQSLETEDHIAFGFEVMRWLIAGDDAALCNLAQQQRFFRSHLQPWVEKLCAAVEAHPRPTPGARWR